MVLIIATELAVVVERSCPGNHNIQLTVYIYTHTLIKLIATILNANLKRIQLHISPLVVHVALNPVLLLSIATVFVP